MRRSFTIAVMLAAMVVASAQAQTNQSSTGSKSLVDLEAQSKAKRKTTAASNEHPQTPAADGTTTTGTTPAKKTTARKPVVRTTTARRTTTATKPAAKKPAPAEAPAAETNSATAAAPASGAATTAGAAPMVATPTAAAAPAPAPAAPDAGYNDKKIYKSNELPDKWKFRQEKAPEPEKKPVTDGTGATAAPVPDPAAVAVAPVAEPAAAADATPAVAPVAAAPAPAPASVAVAPAPAAPASASPAPAAAAPVTTQTPAGTQQKPQPAPKPAPAKPADKPADKPAPKPAPKAAAKPSSNAWRDRGYFSGNVGWQATSTTFSDSRSLATLTGDPELRQMTSKYEVKAGPMFDIGAGIRLVKNLGVAVSVTRFSVSSDIAIDATVPHPFFFNTPRAVSGATPGTREELAIHLDAVYVIPGKKLQVAIFGGPTFFNAKQTVVSDFTYNDVFPYDAPPTFTSATSTQESKSVTGFNAGADIGYYFTNVFGVGGVIRFSRGTFASSIGDLDLGGPQVSAGVRIRFRSSPSSSKKTPPPPKPPQKDAAKPAPKKK